MRYTGDRVPPRSAIEVDLSLGPTLPQNGVKEFSVEQLEAAWRAYGKVIMDEWPRHRPGFRPWAYWEWEVGEHPENREAQVLRLAELDLLFDEELEALAERRTWTDINDGSKHVDEKAVELYERVPSRNARFAWKAPV